MKKKKIKNEIVLGEKVKDVAINQRQHSFFYVFMLIFFNSLMLASIWYVLMCLPVWYNWVLCTIIFGVCFGFSFRSYLNVKDFHKCEIYDNAVVVTSIWFNYTVQMQDIYEMVIKETILDKLFKINTKSLEIKIFGHKRKHLTIHFIEEDAEKLKQHIKKLIDKDQQRNRKIAD